MEDPRPLRLPTEEFERSTSMEEVYLHLHDLSYYLERWYDVVVHIVCVGGDEYQLWTESAPGLDVSVFKDTVDLRVGHWFYTARSLPADGAGAREVGAWLEDLILGIAGGGLAESYPDDELLPLPSVITTPAGHQVAGACTSPSLDDLEDAQDFAESYWGTSTRDAIAELGGRWPAWPLRDEPLPVGARAERPGDVSFLKRALRRLRAR